MPHSLLKKKISRRETFVILTGITKLSMIFQDTFQRFSFIMLRNSLGLPTQLTIGFTVCC
jgi:hypothetical protein